MPRHAAAGSVSAERKRTAGVLHAGTENQIVQLDRGFKNRLNGQSKRIETDQQGQTEKGRMNVKLYEGNIGETYTVRTVMIDEAITRRLEALGVNERTQISVLNKKKSGTMIIKVRGTRLALGRKITGGIEVETAAGGKEAEKA